MSCLPQRASYALQDLNQQWQAELSDLKDWIIQGELIVHTWLPLMSVFKLTESVEGITDAFNKELTHWEGHISVSKHRCHRLFKYGSTHLRDFASEDDGYQYMLPQSANDLTIMENDLVVLRAEKLRFEQKFQVGGHEVQSQIEPPESSVMQIIDPSFKMIRIEGEEYKFTNMQANVLKQLYEASQTDEPWCSGKQLLEKAGSQAFKLSTIFKRKPIWRKIILSDNEGMYRFIRN